VADGVESFADLFSSLIVWRGLVVAAAPADKDHPYGHGKAEPIAVAVVAVMLIGAAGWIALTAVREIIVPHSSPAPFTLIVLLVVILVKESLFRWGKSKAESLESSAVEADAWHHRSDAITSGAAFIGIGIALLGGPGYETADDWAALLASGMIGWNGLRMLRGAGNELMDARPDPQLEQRVREIAEGVPDVRRVEKCFVRKMGFYLFVDMHVHVDGQMPVVRAHAIAHQVKDRVLAAQPSVRDVLVHIEPDGQINTPGLPGHEA
jgi:cation diffusion facilitator family transporter